jgi:hypothetical protein
MHLVLLINMLIYTHKSVICTHHALRLLQITEVDAVAINT